MPETTVPGPTANSIATDLSGRTAVVTGAGSGIGRAVALGLARNGAHVVLVGRQPVPLADVARRVAEGGGSAVALAADVCGADWLEQLDALAPAVDVAVHNAAAYAPFASVEDGDPAAFRLVHATIVDAAYRLIQHVLPGMKERGFGRIILMGSLAGELGGAGQAAYASAKAALLGLTRTVAVEVARFGVTANVVQPGLIDTGRIDRAVQPHVRDRIVAGVPARRLGTPDEVAHAVVFLASPQSGYITGAALPVSGGLGLGLYAGGAA